jgi:hypothetical protein
MIQCARGEIRLVRSHRRQLLRRSWRLASTTGAREIIEAIYITAAKRHIESPTERIKYVSGILRQKRLEKLLPDRATEKNEYNKAMVILKAHWSKQPRGAGYLDKRFVAKWLDYCSIDEIKTVMDVAEGIWSDLRTQMEGIIEARKEKQT